MIGSICRECLNHLVVLTDRQLKRVLREYVDYYNRARTHLSLDKDAPVSRPRESGPGQIVATPILGGLHHVYHRAA